METISKILIAYDGSECSDAALEDLKRAGLPEVLQAVVVTLADIVPPFSAKSGDDDPGPTTLREIKASLSARDRVGNAIKLACRDAERAATRLRGEFPKWDVRMEVDCAASAWSLVRIGDQDSADLIIVGSHRPFVAGGRLILGSVSQRVLYDARCSVRVARSTGKRGGPVQILIGFNGTPQADAAVEAVLSRVWPEGSEVRIVTASQPVDSDKTGAVTEKLRRARLAASYTLRNGKPAQMLLREAEACGADCIFLGTSNLHGYHHLLHGSVAATVAARARCSVEVVRPVMATRQVAA